MISLFDATVLARTKLRTHRTRTGIVVGIAGLLFGLIVLVLVIVQGVFDSINRYSEVGLNNRAILSVGTSGTAGFNLYDHTTDKAFIQDVEAAHASIVAKKVAAAKKFNVAYDPAYDDPSPITIDPLSKEKSISYDAYNNTAVNQVLAERNASDDSTFSIDAFIADYPSATSRGTFSPLQPSDGTLTYIERQKSTSEVNKSEFSANNGPSLSVLDSSISEPFITSQTFDASKGEVPVIFPYLAAEKLLNLKPLEKDSSLEAQRERLSYVRSHIDQATTAFCYRNNASIALLSEATAQQDEFKRAANNPDYIKPSVIYSEPDEANCGAITIKSDTRSAAEKQYAANFILYQKEIGEWQGEPFQQKIVLRGVGVSAEVDTGAMPSTISSFVTSLLASNLGYNTWTIPADLLAEIPEANRPAALFTKSETADQMGYNFDQYLVEFSDKDEARALMKANSGSMETYVYPFGSGTLIVDEARDWVEKILFWALVVVGGIAAIILAGIIGRTVADSRRESAVFRAIGATRFDIASIYGVYALLLSWRVVIFALVLGVGIALVVDLLYTEQATIGAQVAYAAVDTNIQFHLFSIVSWYLPVVIGVIILVGIIASIIPIITASRRNPINDMRDDT